MAKVRVRTFRGYADFESIREAEQEAKNMIMDIIVDGFESSLWWAQVYRYDLQVIRTWGCPEVGKWIYSTWVHIDKMFFDLYC